MPRTFGEMGGHPSGIRPYDGGTGVRWCRGAVLPEGNVGPLARRDRSSGGEYRFA